AETTLEHLRMTYDRDEYVDAIAPVLKASVDRATAILAQSAQQPAPVPGAVPTMPGEDTSDVRILRSGTKEFTKPGGVKEIERELTEAQKTSPGARLRVTWEIYEK
ncbi:MAG TPA: hypothetical protein VF713_14280, partial [Thermoanaerobaculia bacterium]